MGGGRSGGDPTCDPTPKVGRLGSNRAEVRALVGTELGQLLHLDPYPRAQGLYLGLHVLGVLAEFTDDTALVAAAGGRITTVPGHASAFKITTPADLEL